mmetsp:Transcript_9043/g.10359  ORF Transcript_9043/g.10359 Transcript_9043/m.10359 type:complete len:177 (-) Transcript_9043:299-829(-)
MQIFKMNSLVQLLIISLLCIISHVQSFQQPHQRHASLSKDIITREKLSYIVSYKQQRRYDSSLSAGIFDGIGKFIKSFTIKATASHILMKGGAEAENKLEDLKVEIDNSPVQFAAAAGKYSSCPSSKSGGSLGEFGPGAMVKEFDDVVFNKEVGVVHGPIKTQFGYHLIYISDRTE